MKKTLTQELIMMWTAISDDELSALIFKAGCLYNEVHLGDQSEILKYKAYWDWFENEWSRADDAFESRVQMDENGGGLKYNGQFVDVTMIRLIYVNFHKNWMNGKYPNSVIMHDTYKVMAHNVIKEVRKEAYHG